MMVVGFFPGSCGWLPAPPPDKKKVTAAGYDIRGCSKPEKSLTAAGFGSTLLVPKDGTLLFHATGSNYP